MLNIVERLANGLNVMEFLTLVRNEGKTDNQLTLTLKMLGKASFVTYTTIRFCEQKELVSMKPTSSNSYVFNITSAGIKFLKTNKYQTSDK